MAIVRYAHPEHDAVATFSDTREDIMNGLKEKGYVEWPWDEPRPPFGGNEDDEGTDARED